MVEGANILDVSEFSVSFYVYGTLFERQAKSFLKHSDLSAIYVVFAKAAAENSSIKDLFSFRKPGNPWALEQAKHNLVTHYLLVGVTEEMLEFLSVLEAALPRLFKGATDHYLSSNKSHLRQTSSKIEPNYRTIEKIQQSPVWRMENELYEFAIEHFKFVKKKILLKEVNSVAQIFFYEKIRPK